MRILIYLAIGATIGTASGALGIGGGILLVPALMWLCGFKPGTAAGTSLAVLSLPIVLPAAYKYYLEKRLDLEAALYIAPAFAIGGYFGATIVDHLDSDKLKLGFGFMMIYIAMRFLIVSDSEFAHAFAGSTAVAIAWAGYLWFRMLGRKHLQRPDLGQQIRASQDSGTSSADYHI